MSTETLPQSIQEPKQNILDKLAKWLEDKSDLFNPILVKEIRRSIKSSEFVITFLLLIIISWLISVFGVLTYGPSIEFGSPSRGFFISYFYCISFATLVIVPFSAYRSLIVELDHQTMELLNITALSPGRIIWGKMLTAMVQTFLFNCLAAPFISFTSLLQGFDFIQFSYILYLGVLASVLLTISCLAITMNIKTGILKNLSTGILLIGLLITYSWISSGITLGFFVNITNFDFTFMIINVFASIFGLIYFFLCHQIAVSSLTFESDDKSSGIRFTVVTLYLLGALLQWISIFYIYGASVLSNEFIFTTCMAGVILWLALGFFSIGKNDFLSRRIRIQMKKCPLIIRMIYAFLLPGTSRAYLISTTGLLFNLYISFFVITDSIFLNTLIIATGYSILYLGIQSVLMKIMLNFSAESKPIHGKMTTFLVLAVGTILPIIVNWIAQDFFNYLPNSYEFWSIVNPFQTIYMASKNHELANNMALPVCLLAFVFFVINFNSVLKAIIQVVFPKLDGPAIQRIESYSDVRGPAVN